MSTPKKPNELAKKIADAIRDSMLYGLRIHGLEHSNLADSIDVRIRRNSMEVYLAFYWRFVEIGRKRGLRKIPIFVIIKWIKRKGLSAPGKSVNQLAWAIQNSIHENGIAPRPFLKQSARKAEEAVFALIGEYFEVLITTNLF